MIYENPIIVEKLVKEAIVRKNYIAKNIYRKYNFS